jgi:hypothetical protein
MPLNNQCCIHSNQTHFDGFSIMHSTIDLKMESALSFIKNSLFNHTTNLIYDYLSDFDTANPFAHLPWPDEIAASCPNPCGWGTGMEDSMLNAGSLMETLCLKHALLPDPTAKQWADRLLEGMILCSTVHGVKGFVARSVSPHDKKSCYINSSRDQFTLCVYGAWRYWQTFADSDPAGGVRARQLIESIAQYCEENIIVNSQNNLQRLDGKPGLASDMIGVQVHEIMRLPMFFAAAWDITGSEHWKKYYLKYATNGIKHNIKLDENLPWWDISFSQMQLSLALLYDIESNEPLKSQYNEALTHTAQLASRFFRPVLAKALDKPGDWSEKNTAWRLLPMYLQQETIKAPDQSIMTHGYAYLNPRFPQPFRDSQRLLQAVGNYMMTLCLAPDFQCDPDILNGFKTLISRPDYKNHGSDGPVRLLHGYWLAKHRQLID